MNLILPSGISRLDRLLDRGLTSGLITHVFGEAAAGKTTLALGFVSSALDLDIRSIYINSESSSPIERLEQITRKKFDDLEEHITLLLPKNFDEQGTIVEDLKLFTKRDTGLVVVDTMTRLYRAILDDKKSNYAAHRELNRQMGFLKGIARQQDIAVLVLNQVRAKMDGFDGIEPVANSIMEYWSDYVIKIRSRPEIGTRLLERLVPKGEPSSVVLNITNDGLTTEQGETVK